MEQSGIKIGNNKDKDIAVSSKNLLIDYMYKYDKI